MAAAEPLDPAKRLVLAERLAGYLRVIRGHPSDRDLKAALAAAMRGLQHVPSAPERVGVDIDL